VEPPDLAMAINEQAIAVLTREILRVGDPRSIRYGKLLNWTDGLVWHYGIGLTNSRIFDTGKGMQVFRYQFPPKEVIGVDDLLFRPGQIVERLIQAIEIFRQWDYGLLGWNCEHFARLVATDDPVSYEVLKQPWPIPALNHDGRHPTARQELRAHLRRHAPELLVRRV
jgi:hypothetical protein